MDFHIDKYISLDIQEIALPLVVIPTLDILLMRILSNRARWFQLHTAINMIITCIIFRDVKQYFIEPLSAVVDKTSNIDNYFIIGLHIYHCLTFTSLSQLDYFHHLVFVLLGVVPCAFFIKSNINRFLTFTGCGLPGIIEYGSLTLVKNGVITSLQQKQINSYMYIYLRNPLAIFNVAFMYIAYIYNIFHREDNCLIIWIMFLSYFNGTFYNKLAVENYRDTYWKLRLDL